MNSRAEATANINNQKKNFKGKMKKIAGKNNGSFIEDKKRWLVKVKEFFYSFIIIELLAFTLKDDIMS